MSEMNEEILEESHGLEIQSALLHVIDGRRHRIYLSERTLDIEDEMIENYVTRYVKRCLNDSRAKKGSFNEESAFAEELDVYFHGKETLAEFSAKVLEGIISYFENEEARSFEILTADFRFDDVPYVAFIFLEEVDTAAYVSDVSQGLIYNTITFGNTSLPAVSRPLSVFAIVNPLNGEISLVDEGKWKDGNHLLSEKLLDSSEGFSHQEIIETVHDIAVEVADEFDENPVAVLSRVKAHIAESAAEGMPLRAKTIAEEVFEDEPEMALAFLRKAEEKTLPKETELPPKAVKPSMKKQKVRTDTGIEISFPAEYVNEPDKISFRENPDGTITITIDGVRSVETRN